VKKISSEQSERFWRKVAKGDLDVCWEWQGAKTGSGYGNFWLGKATKAHRVAYQLTHGELPTELVVMHTCDNRPCCNPSHLKLGTHQENSQDMVSKSRQSRMSGEKHGMSKLTADEVSTIRQLLKGGERCNKIAQRFGVNRSHISNIKAGRTWASTQ
jgi:hypothetical protein